MSRSRMHDDARRLVDHEEVLVLVRNADGYGLVLDRGRVGRRLEVDLLPTLEPPRLRTDEPVDVHARGDHALGRRAGADVLGDESIEAQAYGVIRDADAHAASSRP